MTDIGKSMNTSLCERYRLRPEEGCEDLGDMAEDFAALAMYAAPFVRALPNTKPETADKCESVLRTAMNAMGELLREYHQLWDKIWAGAHETIRTAPFGTTSRFFEPSATVPSCCREAEVKEVSADGVATCYAVRLYTTHSGSERTRKVVREYDADEAAVVVADWLTTGRINGQYRHF